MKKSILIVVVCAAFGLQAFAQEAAKVPNKLTADAADARRQSFDIVWRTVKEKHFDPTFGGVDWDAVRRKYELRLAKVKKDGELYLLLNVKHTRASLLAGRDAQLEKAIMELQKSPRRER